MPPQRGSWCLKACATSASAISVRSSHGPAGWQAQWVRGERLPDLVSIRIEFEDERRNEPARIVALRQG